MRSFTFYKPWHSLLKIALMILILLTGILMIFACVDIYLGSDHDPYSPASIAQAFQKIHIAVWATVVFILLGILVDLFVPAEKMRSKAIVSEDIPLRRLHQKLPKTDAVVKVLSHRRRNRRILALIPCILSVLLMIYPIFYFSDLDHFTITRLNADIIKAVLVVLTPAMIALCSFFVSGILIRQSFRKEIALCKQLSARSPGETTFADVAAPSKKRDSKRYMQGGIFLLAIGLILLGIFNGGAHDVLKKAIAICTECIGLG